ncbi:MAG: 5-carboxymethyl-2-hydroxymuconate Delta-isomerase [Polaromonas sp.]|uniref:5-carboxymethyl-2-hydroxymuconate Delta-isomerase n=1 Tax=Polaromonas sp. TaxID=1869339 RepID=UPI00273148FB|nr:5-carboxymethyl-2-hydroxymuconate Delta-isomerase [Polaromonas sp.]MDP1741051.1 5-carboxymethyl-2-hydroxymuconate Delta-isomerase [Polaromonas sp.]MDP1953981.1 5-carboxymethyl-2-hydroxymuconate Delta-isomerase [Polaromonas sp.]MDP3752755.1 5-carboxymethyl-2-hydroxymuconate Delta-isomerase [Polaromonas sp.]
MPHLKIEYTDNIEAQADMGTLCRGLAQVLGSLKDEQGLPLFPLGGTRVLAYPAPHHAVADGGDHAFVYLNLRIAIGRSDAMKTIAGDALLERAKAHFSSLFSERTLGITLQIDEGVQVYDGKHSNLHTLFSK